MCLLIANSPIQVRTVLTLMHRLYWFKHFLFMKKKIGRGLKRDKSNLLEGLFTKEPTHTHSHT